MFLNKSQIKVKKEMHVGEKERIEKTCQHKDQMDSKAFDKKSILSTDQAWFRKVAKLCPLWQEQEA